MTSKPTPGPRAAGGPNLQADVTEAIVSAALDEFAEKGYSAMSVDGVARRAGVGKMTIYRRWASKEAMAIAVLAAASHIEDDIPDHGSLRADIDDALREMRSWLGDPRMRKIFPDVLAEGVRNPRIAAALTKSIANPRRRRGLTILQRAEDRGEMDPAADKELILDLMGGLVFWRLIGRRQKVTDATLGQILEIVLDHAQRPDA